MRVEWHEGREESKRHRERQQTQLIPVSAQPGSPSTVQERWRGEKTREGGGEINLLYDMGSHDPLGA